MTLYRNPHTGKLETPEEMGERPADSETVLPVACDAVSRLLAEIHIEELIDRIRADLPRGGLVIGSTDTGRNHFWPVSPSTAPDSPPPQPPRPGP